MSAPLTSFERAARLFKKAEKLGCDTPTESMIADAIQDAEFDTLHNPEIIAERHGQQLAPLLRRLNAQRRDNSVGEGNRVIAAAGAGSIPAPDRQLLLLELQAAQDHLARCAGAIVRADHSLAHLMYQTGMQIKTLIDRTQ